MFAEIGTAIIYCSLFLSLFFEVFLLITYFEKKDSISYEEKRITGPNLPSVTIIVPCYNEEKTIIATITSLLDLDYPKDKLSILIIDDGSTDNSKEVLKQYEQNPQIKVFSKENGGKYTVLNFGLEHTKTELVGCLDADSFVAQDALQRIVVHFEDPEVMAVTPAIKVHNPQNVLQLIQKVEYGWGVFLRKMLSYLGAIYVTPGPFSIFRTDVFRKLGGYKHAHHTEDFELALRMQKHNYKIVNAHDAHVYTVTPDNLYGLYKQRLRWTYGFLNNVIDYRFMLFKKEFGNIGIFILPMATISIFSALYSFGLFLWTMGGKTLEYIERVRIVGFDFSLGNILGFDWFYVNTGSPIFIAGVLLVLSTFILILSRIMTEGRFRFSFDLVYFLTLYAFIVPLWLSRAVYNTVFAKKISWR